VAGGGVLVMAMGGLAARLTYLQLGPHEDIRAAIARSREIRCTIPAARGSIMDCRGKENILAASVTVWNVCASPDDVIAEGNADRVADALAPILGVRPEEIMSKLHRPGSRYAVLKKHVQDETAEAVRKLGLKGVFLEESSIRSYPNGASLCHVVGFVNYEGQGGAGVELAFDKYLKGMPGYLGASVDAKRDRLYSEDDTFIAPVPGADVVLTVDQNIQHMVERALDQVMDEHNAKGAWAIVQRVRTGEILAMASRPAFDLNRFFMADMNAMTNRCIGIVYEPGSTFKAIAISAALNERTVTPETVFDCENGAWMYKGRVLRDYHAYSHLSVAEGVKKSSNILTAKVSLTLGEERFYRYLKSFGIGQPTGIELSGEESGILAPPEKWCSYGITRIAIGQGVAVTALQLIGVYCAIANDGFMMRPYLVKKVVAPSGAVIMENHPRVVGRPISFQTASVMKRLLSGVTEEGGTGAKASLDGYEVAGKTGSAQKPVPGGYSTTAYVASFVGFLPCDEPEIAIIVVIDEPQPYHTGGVVAAPAFKRIAGDIVKYLDIPPDSCRLASAGL